MKEKSIFCINVIGTILQFVGTLWLWIDSLHVSARLPSEGMTLGDPIEYRTWYYHWASPIGFGLLMIGFANALCHPLHEGANMVKHLFGLVFIVDGA